MIWLYQYHIRAYLKNSIYFFPMLAIVAGIFTAVLLRRIDLVLRWTSAYPAEDIRLLLSALAAAMFTCIVFVSSTLLLVLQIASAQLTPRIINSVFRDNTTRFAMTYFVFTFTLALSALMRIGQAAPLLMARVSIYSCALGLALLLYLVDHIGHQLRPNGALSRTARLGNRVLRRVYKRSLREAPETERRPAANSFGPSTGTVISAHDGVVLAVNTEGLLRAAKQVDGVIEMVPQVGQFVASGEPLFRVYGTQAPPPQLLLHSIALGQERTYEQDPMLAFRIIVDIACKALSPAINDPTTAVLALDQIENLLRSVGWRKLDDGRLHDPAGKLRVIFRRPCWDDYVTIAITEVRLYGSESIQVARRLRALLGNLIHALPEQRAPALRRQLDMLHESAARSFAQLDDRQCADVPDSQGVGGAVEESPDPLPSNSSTQMASQ